MYISHADLWLVTSHPLCPLLPHKASSESTHANCILLPTMQLWFVWNIWIPNAKSREKRELQEVGYISCEGVMVIAGSESVRRSQSNGGITTNVEFTTQFYNSILWVQSSSILGMVSLRVLSILHSSILSMVGSRQGANAHPHSISHPITPPRPTHSHSVSSVSSVSSVNIGVLHPLWLPQALNQALHRQCTSVGYIRSVQWPRFIPTPPHICLIL